MTIERHDDPEVEVLDDADVAARLERGELQRLGDGDAEGRFGDAEATGGDAGGNLENGVRPSGSVPKAPLQRPRSVPKKGRKSARTQDPPDAGDAGDAHSLILDSEEKREENGEDQTRVEDKGGSASPASPDLAVGGGPECPTTSTAGSAPVEPKDPKLAEVVICAIEAQADLFHDAKGDTFASLVDSSNVERTTRMDTGAFRAWIAYAARKANGQSVGPSTIDEARLALQGIALYERPEKSVRVRVAEHEGALYLDLGDDTGACIECASAGWRIIERAPVKFIRPSGMRPLPRPVRGGSVNALRPFVNVSSDKDFYLMLAWLIAAYRPGRPFTLAALQGEQGTAKTSAARVLRRLVDPNVADVRSPPRCEDDLMVMAHNSHVLSVDNLSGLPQWLSDAFCRVATGGGLSKRAHYENAEEVIVEALRPTILNGIDDIANRSDLAERSIVFALEPIEKGKRRPEATFWADFYEAAPGIFGALLDAVCCALENIGKVKIRELPRMADFIMWATAAEPALGLKHGTLQKAYKTNLAGASAVALEASVVAVAVRALVRDKSAWEGTPEALLNVLVPYGATADGMLPRAWPKDPTRLSGRLKRDAVPLRDAGIHVEFTKHGRGKHRARWIKLQLQKGERT